MTYYAGRERIVVGALKDDLVRRVDAAKPLIGDQAPRGRGRCASDMAILMGRGRSATRCAPFLAARRWTGLLAVEAQRMNDRDVRSVRKTMLITTTPAVDGKRITKYLGIVTGEAILGANVFKDIFAGIRDIVGGRSATYEAELHRARDLVIAEMQEQAVRLGANAVVGVDLDYEVLGPNNGMLMVSASGTAVQLE